MLSIEASSIMRMSFRGSSLDLQRKLTCSPLAVITPIRFGFWRLLITETSAWKLWMIGVEENTSDGFEQKASLGVSAF